jgi:hypothetical protein
MRHYRLIGEWPVEPNANGHSSKKLNAPVCGQTGELMSMN